jgi:hypothetical protein
MIVAGTEVCCPPDGFCNMQIARRTGIAKAPLNTPVNVLGATGFGPCFVEMPHGESAW